MIRQHKDMPVAAPGQTKVADNTDNIVDKRGFAARWKFSPRHVDNFLAAGLPHLKVGSRRVRILIDEADAWMKSRFGTQRNGPLAARKQ
jgi:hypothetical protein